MNPGLWPRSRIDELGVRLREGAADSDLILLDHYRNAFRGSYEIVVSAILSRLRIEPSGRPAKSTPAIVSKLKRGSMRLSQMQDVAGCRIVVCDVAAQDRAAAAIAGLFPVSIADRRSNPSHGYRAL